MSRLVARSLRDHFNILGNEATVHDLNGRKLLCNPHMYTPTMDEFNWLISAKVKQRAHARVLKARRMYGAHFIDSFHYSC